MKEVEFQGQHRISQVYLKQFGFKRDGKWYISVWKKCLNHTDIELVESFSKEINVFDLPYNDFKLRRHFENTSNIIEREYPKIINTIANQHQLISKHKYFLCLYVANLICRTKPYRDFFDLCLKNKWTRNKFLGEMTMFKEETLPELKQFLDELKADLQLNVAIDSLMNHLVHVFKAFSFIILKDFGNRGWLTSDNPIVIDKQNNHSWIVPVEAEIYFPLSKNFCLFMFHKGSEAQANPLRRLKINKITNIDELTHKIICDRIIQNNSGYLIFPAEIHKTYFNDDEKNG
jgi:hypothetical protein